MCFLVREGSDVEMNEIKKYYFDRVIAIGGCTCLDMGKIVSGNKEFYVIPTILSTSCISSNYSAIKFKGIRKIMKSNPPLRVIIPIKEIMSTTKLELEKWSSSGMGDYFSNISASIDMQFRKNDLDGEKIKNNVKDTFLMIKWISKKFKKFDKKTLIKFAKSLHLSSLDVINKGNLELSSGSEHKFYHAIMRQQKHYTTKRPTHGQLVYIGALLNAKVYEIVTGNKEIFSLLLQAGKKLGLPINRKMLKSVGIKISEIKKALIEIKDYNGLLTNYIKKNGTSIIKDVFK